MMYFNIIFSTEKIKSVLLFIKNDHKYYMNRPENTILQYYAVQGSKIGFYYVCYLYITCVAYVLLPTISLVIDEILSSNHSEGKSFPVVLDYGVDMDQYFYHLFIPVYASMLMIANVVASYDNTYMLHVQHTYALFAIVSYKLKTILDTVSLINLKNDRSFEKYNNMELLPIGTKIFRKLVLCIKEHQNAIEYSNLVESLFTKSILAQLFCSVVCLSIAGVETVLNLDDADYVMRFGGLALAQVIHIFALCLPGQRLLNHGEEVHAAACEIMWYMLPKNCLNLYTFLLARTMVFNKITAFKLAVMSMETFLAIIQTAMSYFTVLLSVI
ncbi:hypothetical protein K0M31_006139 [Melipona bicolor]|uniref:Odorant receptor n=1 Tax=Melipona bicolor TaxID=60889 RepID=A0AA40KLG3_9HYME|nr:hypothetical protein K0M31_006139 [Melipona bicolor]